MPTNDSKKDRKRLAPTRVLLLLACLNIIYAADPLPIAKPEAVGLSSARLERLARAIQQDVDHGRTLTAVVVSPVCRNVANASTSVVMRVMIRPDISLLVVVEAEPLQVRERLDPQV